MDIRRFLHLNKLELFGLIETRVKNNKWKKVSNFISESWSVCTNHQSHKGGRIWVLWNPQVLTLDIQHISAQTIHTKITDRGRNLTYWVTFVYGYNKVAERKVLWSTLEHYHKVTPGAWIGAHITSAELSPFQNCVQSCGVEDIKAIGSFFTWTNKQEASSRVYSRIDRALINDAWLHLFPESFANFLPEGVYDHCPCLIQLESNDKTRNIPFRYFNMWAKSPEFLGIITKHWNAPIYGTPMYKVVNRMKAMKSDLKQLNRDNFHDVEKNAQIMLMTLHSIQTELQTRPLDPQLIEAEKVAADGFKVLDEARTSFLAQKAKVSWLEEGDDNTAFFHSAIKKRRIANKVMQIEDQNGIVHTQIQGINDAFESYYKQILGTSCHSSSSFPSLLDEGLC
ncbi:uncharacterized protein LOC141617049 [Silene latifolia]|uniref:uncharacterized protein LOC141617049 n=1 Tax=Silene latifolia TaxID=37657 RepID=UPI003D781F96